MAGLGDEGIRVFLQQLFWKALILEQSTVHTLFQCTDCLGGA